MAGRVAELSFGDRVGRVGAVETNEVITPQLVDEAVEDVLRSFSEDVREQHRRAWASDETSEVARLIQSSMLARTSRLRAYADMARLPITVRNQLTPVEQRSVVERYRELDINFTLQVKHDHSLGAVDRLLGTAVTHSEVPVGMPYADFGGNIVMHVEQGNTDVIVVGDIHDVKDPARSQKSMMRLSRIAADSTAKPVSRDMAASVLAGDGRFLHVGSLETFKRKVAYGVMTHVYDVELIEIPKMMYRCGMLAFSGMIHFSSRFFFEESGVLESVGARFRIDGGRFEMGFLDSPSHWYTHDWNKFQHYGADQVIAVGDKCYGYKIHKRKGDTICFRILQLGGKPRPVQQFMTRPGVPMVEVSTQRHKNVTGVQSKRLATTKRYYPQDVWTRMVRSAMLDASRGELDFNKHVSSYRNIIAGHKYNGASTVSQTVETTDVPWLVVDSALCGLSHVIQLRRSTRAFALSELEKRAVAGKYITSVIGGAMLKGFLAVLSLPFLPFSALVNLIISGSEPLLDAVVMAAPVERHVQVDPRSLMTNTSDDYFEAEQLPVREHLLRTYDIDLYVSSVVKAAEAEQKAVNEPRNAKIVSDGTVLSGDDTTYSGSTQFDALPGKPDWVPLADPSSGVVERYERGEGHTPEQRSDAVLEDVRCVDAEAKELETWCSTRFATYASGRRPDATEIMRVSERNSNFDFWYVTDGIVQFPSVSGVEQNAFSHGGVYCPVAITVLSPEGDDVQTHLVPTRDIVYEDPVRGVFRSHVGIDADYTGLVMTCDGLKILNGPHIAAGLRAATSKSFDFELAGMVGGPGCGKTYSITQAWKPGDIVVSPLKLSVASLRSALIEKKQVSPRLAQRSVRTIDSILCEVGRNAGFAGNKLVSAETVYVDEAFNTSAGRVYAVLSLLKARRCMVYGDKMQIEHVVRADVTRLYPAIAVTHVVRRFTVFRGPPEVLACFNSHYDNTLRTASKKVGQVKIVEGACPLIPAGMSVLILVMNQADKPKAARIYPGHKGNIYTVHEAQGHEAEFVLLMNFETRPSMKDNPMNLFSKPRYINTGISRSSHIFLYWKATVHLDKVTEWIAKGSEPRAIKACSDMSTAGVSY